ncbi:MAG: hypothetical protein K5798_03575 [Nitrosopumilus sp.]|uniref:hypothetical protein n=1 Tax=Nitrosopumilus sp. TaxID=2024843 RepID=UPI00242C1EE8|nr:hypothetical protein [Nitrosopumilus sp.]MCV0366332.1 hypothetical protein [Nitrosopumilus sp.]
MSSNPSEQLKEWYIVFLTFLRDEYSRLSEKEKRQIILNYDCRPPLQVEVFWLANPNWQFIVTTHFEDRPDLEIVINGPYSSTVFQKKVEEAINNPKWNRPLSKKSQLSTESPELYSEFIAGRLHRLIESAKNMMFVDFPDSNRIMIESIRLENGLTEHVFGDVRRFDPKLQVKKMIKEMQEQIEHHKKMQKQPIQKEKPQEYQKGFGTYFLPPIVVGDIPKPSVTDRLHGVTRGRISTWDKKEFTVTFKKTSVIIRNDGFIGVYTSNKILAIDILNTIMATSEMENLTSVAVRENDLVEIDYDKETQNITGYTYDQNIERNSSISSTDTMVSADAREVDQSKMEQIMEKASIVFEDHDFSIDIRNYVEMLSHLKDSEYPQAFLKGWAVIEHYVLQKWNHETRTLSKNNSKYPTVDSMLKDLKTVLSSNHYNIFMSLKKVRNEHLHKNQSITKKQAQNCLDASRKIIIEKYHEVSS